MYTVAVLDEAEEETLINVNIVDKEKVSLNWF